MALTIPSSLQLQDLYKEIDEDTEIHGILSQVVCKVYVIMESSMEVELRAKEEHVAGEEELDKEKD